MLKKTVKILLLILFMILLFVGFLYINNDIGVPRSMIEHDARSSQKIADDWLVEKDISDTMAALISYPENKSDYTVSIYINRPGISFGYFFRGGGNMIGAEKYIAEFIVEGYNERAFISMNEQKVERLEIDDGNSPQVIEIDSEKPFAIVLLTNAGNVVFYDVNGNIVETYENSI